MPIKIDYKSEQEIRDIKMTGLISYSEVIDETYRLLKEKNLTVKKVIYKPSSNGDTVHATFVIDTDYTTDLQMAFSWTHSYHKAIRFQCNASAITTDGWTVIKGGTAASVKSRRSSDVVKYRDEIFADLKLDVHYLKDTFNDILKFESMLKESNSNLEVAAVTLGILYVQFNILTTSQASVIKDWLTGTTVENGWDLYKCFAEGLRDSHPKQILNDHIDTYLFFQESFSPEPKKELYLPNTTGTTVNEDIKELHDFVSPIPSVIFL